MGVSTSATIDAPVEAVWNIISDFANLTRWHPLVERCETVGSGAGAVRTVHFADWWAAERLDSLDPGEHSLSYSVIDSSRPPNIGVHGSMKLTKLDGNRTQIDWKSGHDDDHPHAAVVNSALEQYYPVRIGHLRSALGLQQ